MPSSDKTTNYKLNQWQENDKPRMEDFNSDNKLIDTVLAGKADAVAPKIYELSFEEGTNTSSRKGTYYKNSFGEVCLYMDIAKEALFSTGNIICNMPQGYRPAHNTIFTVACYRKNIGYAPGVVSIRTDGTVLVDNSCDQAYILRGQIVFPAG